VLGIGGDAEVVGVQVSIERDRQVLDMDHPLGTEYGRSRVGDAQLDHERLGRLL
jgi:hypothetical protein